MVCPTTPPGTGGRAVRPPPSRGCSSPSPHPGDGAQPPEAHLGVGSGPGQSNPLEGDYNLIPTKGKGLYSRWPLLPTFFSPCGRGRTGPRDGGDGLSDHPSPGTGGWCVRLPPRDGGTGCPTTRPRDGVGMGWKEALLPEYYYVLDVDGAVLRFCAQTRYF